LGTVLDPLADKAMLLSALFLFCGRQLLSHPSLPVWFVLLGCQSRCYAYCRRTYYQSHVGHVTVQPRISVKGCNILSNAGNSMDSFRLSGHIFIIPVMCAALVLALSATQYFFDGVHSTRQSKIIFLPLCQIKMGAQKGGSLCTLSVRIAPVRIIFLRKADTLLIALV